MVHVTPSRHARVTFFDGSLEYRQQMDRQNERALVAWFAEMHARTLHCFMIIFQ
jgi:hypothetical protein